MKPKPKIMQEGPAALDAFMRAMKAVFRVPKSAVVDARHKGVAKKQKPKVVKDQP